jgi:hypothetical protein
MFYFSLWNGERFGNCWMLGSHGRSARIYRRGAKSAEKRREKRHEREVFERYSRVCETFSKLIDSQIAAVRRVEPGCSAEN